MRELAILADDLTGALDAAAAFASTAEPVDANWHGLDGNRVVVDTQTRAATPAAAHGRVASFLPALSESATALKKLDSLMRGNSFVELAACCRSDGFDAVYIAPAFPAQGRVTVGGRQVATADGMPLSQPLTEALSAVGIPAVLVRSAVDLPGTGVAVCDAASDKDLDDIVAAGKSRARRVLWCGTAGLARALSGRPAVTAAVRPELVIVGSRHEAARRHVAALRGALGRDAVELVAADGIGSAVVEVAAALRWRGRAVLAFDLPPLSDGGAEIIYRAVFTRLRDSIAPPDAVIVVGGDTAYRLMRALGTTSLSVVGQWAPGVPVSRIHGGAWSGSALVSKSGAFADAGLFAKFIRGNRQSA